VSDIDGHLVGNAEKRGIWSHMQSTFDSALMLTLLSYFYIILYIEILMLNISKMNSSWVSHPHGSEITFLPSLPLSKSSSCYWTHVFPTSIHFFNYKPWVDSDSHVKIAMPFSAFSCKHHTCRQPQTLQFFFFAELRFEFKAYTLSHSSSPFCGFFFFFFLYRVRKTICPGWLQTTILLISASWVARITGMSHQRLAKLFIF
jgi:hypothetical protein